MGSGVAPDGRGQPREARLPFPAAAQGPREGPLQPRGIAKTTACGLKGKKQPVARKAACTAALSAKRRKAVQKRWNKRKADKMCAEDASRLVGDVAGKIERGKRRGYPR